MVKSNADKSTTARNGQKQVETDSNNKGSAGIWQDERFKNLLEDPRFRGVPKRQRKVKIDKRFQSMFTDDKFKVKYTVDKYGRRINKSNADDLRKYYELESTDDEEDDTVKEKDDVETTESNEKKPKQKSKKDIDHEGQKKKSKKESKKPAPVVDSSDDDDGEDEERRAEELAIIASDNDEEAQDENDALSSDGETVPKTLRERLLDPSIDYARGEGRLVTDSSSDDDSSDDDEENIPELQIDHVWGELDVDAETTEESTRRLAVCNMDWDRIRAQDIMILLSSFLPPGGSVLSVKIYPSEFGKARMAEEEVHGPTELVDGGNKEQAKQDDVTDSDSDEDSIENGREQDSDAEQGDDYHMEKLRKYQLNRLRYFYAVVECDSVATADKVYKECDGIEYESSATRVDLRFIPDDTNFDDDVPTDECHELPDMNVYKPRQFTTTALQQAKVDLTWDETALERRELGDKLSSCKLDQISDKDLRQIVAYSSEEDDEDDDNEVQEDNVDDNKVNATNEETLTDGQTETAETTEQTTKKKQTKKQKLKESISKYQALLTEINDKEKQKKKLKNYEMEMTWDIAAEKPKKEEEVETKAKSDLTPIEKVLQKRSEKNKKRKEGRQRKKLEAAGIDPDKANQSDDDMPDDIDMNDPYFAEEFANGDFIEPKSKKNSKKKKQKATQVVDEETERNTNELELLLDDDEDNTKQHFSLEKILKSEQNSSTSKRKRRQQLKKSKTMSEQVEDNFEVNVTDPRFRAVYSSHEYNIDPTDSHFKKTKGMEQIIQEKLKRRQEPSLTDNKDSEPSVAAKRSKKELEDTMLVKSLKRKMQMKMQNSR